MVKHYFTEICQIPAIDAFGGDLAHSPIDIDINGEVVVDSEFVLVLILDDLNWVVFKDERLLPAQDFDSFLGDDVSGESSPSEEDEN